MHTVHLSPVEPLSSDHPHQRPYFVWRSVFCLYDPWPTTIPQTRPTTGSDGIFSLASDHFKYSVFPIIMGGASTSVLCLLDYYNVALRHLWSNSIALSVLLLRQCYNDVISYNVASPPALRHSSLSSSVSRPSGITSGRSDAWIICWTYL